METAKFEGERKGRTEGLAEGERKGRSEGEAHKSFEIARNMKQKGFDTATIAEMTGLTQKEIERLN
jgi:predicted transposase/invertase (TIGR01784 family)